MFRNYLAAALRNLARNRLYVAINIFGLAAGFSCAIVIALFVRNELTYDRHLPGHERVFLVTETLVVPNQTTIVTPMTQAPLARLLQLDIPGIAAIARLARSDNSLRHGDVEADERVYWADPDFLSVVPLRVIAGDASNALAGAEGIVITRRVARKYFHSDAPIGETLEIDRKHPMQVTAVLEDLPGNTTLDTEIIASGRGTLSALALYDSDPRRYSYSDAVFTFLRLDPAASPDSLRVAFPAFVKRHFEALFATGVGATLQLWRLDELHLAHFTHLHKIMRPLGDRGTLHAMAAVAVLVVLIAAINFVNLMTARAGRRAVEVGVRKAVGASRSHLMIQFIAESVLYSAAAMLMAIMLVELLLPSFNAFVGYAIPFDYWSDAMLGGGLALLTLLVGVLAGSYPAFILSAFSPATALKSGVIASQRSASIRQVLVTLQFAILIGLIVTTGVIYRQVMFATKEGLRMDTDQVLIIDARNCSDAFRTEVRRLPGVRAASCASPDSLNLAQGTWPFYPRGGERVWLTAAAVDFGLFELFGLKPVAGRVFSRDREADVMAADFFEKPHAKDLKTALESRAPMTRLVINESAAREAGFGSPGAAIGQTFLGFGGHVVEVIGVVPDFSVDAANKRVAPAVYAVFRPSFRYLAVKLDGRRIPETLGEIDRLWKAVGEPKPLVRFFLDQTVQEMQMGVTRRGQAFAAFAGVAVFIACLGLFGLAAFTAERRTREIGIRRAMGAGRSQIMRLLLWQFARPVLWATLIAWPVAAIFLVRWLNGFAYHVDLEPWVFMLSATIALGIAMLTVSVQSWQAARAAPVKALRHV